MAPPTERLHHNDPLALTFHARVLSHGAWEGRPSVVLDRTAFYPESGGQLGDRGTLAGGLVEDTQVDDQGVVHHLLAPESALPAEGATVEGAVERARRRLQMALHTGQHMLSRALLDVARAETVSSRLGQSTCTVDVDLAHLEERAVVDAEALVNAVVEDDRTVEQFFPSPEVLASLPLRRAPKVKENIRVVHVRDFDVSPCGGTHCTRTSQVGVLTVTGLERYKGKVRVTFLAGRAAVEDLSQRARGLSALARDFTCGPLLVSDAIERLRKDLQASREALGAVRGRWASELGQRLVADLDREGRSHAVLTLDGESVETLRALASRVTARPGTVAFLASRSPDGLLVLVCRGEGSAFDCGAWLKRVAVAHGGRGGGRPDRAEGRLPAEAPWDALAREA
ncbi:MAG: alanyl-tRNA editing protein [Deltaproteobacteria bacterium]|nr:alanyl-tRNA editing protein [Deltaproteobacteria bacterium]